MYVAYDDANIYVGIVTAMDQAGQYAWTTSLQHFPGDIFFDFGNDGTWELAVETGHGGTAGANNTGTGTWWTEPTDYPSSRPAEIDYGGSPTYVGDANFAYTNAITADDADTSWTSRNGDHNVIELSFARDTGSGDWLAGDGSFTVHWTLTCGNDMGEVTGVMPGTPPVPEPGTFVMIGSVLAGLLGARRMKRA